MADCSSSSSVTSTLRHFRLKKKCGTTIDREDVGYTFDDSGRKFTSEGVEVGAVLDCAGEKDASAKSCNARGLKDLTITFPTLKPEVIEKYLIQCEGDFNNTKTRIEEYLAGSTNDTKPVQTQNTNGISPTSSPVVKKRKFTSPAVSNNGKKAKRIKPLNYDSDDYSADDSDGGVEKESDRVFDSDDSDDVHSYTLTLEQKQVLDFLSKATLSELLWMHSSRKKADAIMELRPFNGWRDLVTKVKETRNLGGDILNIAQDFLRIRSNIEQLLKKCCKLSLEMETFATSASRIVTKQPVLIPSQLSLAGYQMEGLNWLVILQRRGLNGILADEMGLGKTVQVIAFLAHLRDNGGHDQEPNLIVVPSSTLDNWTNELARWCPALNVFVYYGEKEERRVMRAQSLARGGIKDYDVLLTTYAMLVATPEERKMFRVLKFQYVVFDEAHMLKNMKTTRYEQLSQVNASRRILLTGTPLQNNLWELISLLAFVMPDMFRNKKEYLKRLFSKNSIKEKGEEGAEGEAASAAAPEALTQYELTQVAQARKIMKPFVLRRLKKDVLKDLPKKTDIIRNCDMSPRQRDMYDTLIAAYRKSASNGQKEEGDLSGVGMMMQLRKLANHPLLVRQLYDEEQIEKLAKLLAKEPSYNESNVEYIQQDLHILSDFEIHRLCESFPKLGSYALKDAMIVDSGKFLALDELMPNLVKDGHRVLIFSQFVTMLDIMERYLAIRGHKFLRFDGSTPVPVRQQLIDQYTQDPSYTVFLLSTKAGGLGINLTAADTVIIHDLDFNPYNDKQAEDRCHRVGQTKPVTVYRFISKTSIDEDIFQIAREKLHLEKEISAEDKEEVMETTKLLKKVLGLNLMNSPTPKKVPNGSVS